MGMLKLPKEFLSPWYGRPWAKPVGSVVLKSEAENPICRGLVSVYLRDPLFGYRDFLGNAPALIASSNQIPDNEAHETNPLRTWGFVVGANGGWMLYKKTNESSGSRTIRVHRSGSTWEFLTGNTSGNWTGDDFTVTADYTKPYFAAASLDYEEDGGEFKRIYAGGSYHEKSGNHGPFKNTTDNWQLGNGGDNWHMFLVWNRYLSIAELDSVNADPYQLFKPANEPVYFLSAAGGATNISIDSTTQGQSTETVALTQNHILAVDETIQAQSSENIGLTQNHILSVDETTQAQQSDAVSLSQNNILAIEETIQSQSSEVLSLSQNHIAVFDDTSQSQDSDNFTLTQLGTLSIEETIQGQSSEDLSLSQNNILNFLDTLQSASSEDIDLVQNYVLNFENTLQNSLSEDVQLTISSSSISISDTLQAAISEDVSLVQNHILAIADTIQTQIFDTFNFLTSSQIDGIDDTIQFVVTETIYLSDTEIGPDPFANKMVVTLKGTLNVVTLEDTLNTVTLESALNTVEIK